MHKKRDILKKEVDRFMILHPFDIYWRKIDSKKPRMHHLACKVCADYMLISRADSDWMCTCVTCWKKGHWSDPHMQWWHYIKQWDSNHLRYTKENVHPQCYSCNVAKSGNYQQYVFYMIKTYWEGFTKKLASPEMKKPGHTWKNRELADMIAWWWLDIKSEVTNYVDQNGKR